MLPSGDGSTYGYGFTSLGLTQGTDFKCVDKSGKPLPICFGIGAANHATLQQLQQALNQLSSMAGFATLDVDGFIGPLTVDALNAVVRISGGGSVRTKEEIAADAPALIEQLNALASRQSQAGRQLAPTGAPVQPTVQTATAAGLPKGAATQVVAVTTAPTAQDAAAAEAAAPSDSAGLLPWIVGGVALVLAVGVGGYFYYRSKQPKAAGWGDDEDGWDDADGDFEDVDLEDPDFEDAEA